MTEPGYHKSQVSDQKYSAHPEGGVQSWYNDLDNVVLDIDGIEL